MTPSELIAAVAQYAAPTLVALGGLYGIHVKGKRELATLEAKRKADEDALEAKRIADRNKTQAEHEGWLRETVEMQMAQLNADRERERAECTKRIDDQGAEIEKLRDHVEERDTKIDALEKQIDRLLSLAERLLQMVSQIDPYKTPTAEQMEAMRRTAAEMGLRPSVVPSLVVARGGAK